ncbi:hypothetical protein GCM10009557_74860 [Virgisporangium ochraceum]|uniref:DUF8175 domain-containing protein n=1 Tax=Virgisporangium ochraceum TaxID=65505 RepID=A0A8J4A394_9ACTN|nr:hypothetical protein [Virgisporangium ochraceum]GIJ75059.1 hypothetical protein Voc01_099760 [Virgisporangium ochraceum]
MHPSAAGSAAPTGSASASADTTVPTSAPADVTWQLSGVNPVPVSASAGPRNITPTSATGFARTPTGALVAAAQIIGHTATDPKVAETTIAQQWVAGPDRDKALAMAREEGRATPKPGKARTPMQITGFRYVVYDPDTAVVSVVYQVSGSLAAMTVTMRWIDDDWRMVPPAGGNWSTVMSVTDGSGMVEWGPR